MFKDILILSDNVNLCRQFDKLLREFSFPGVNWTFAVSPFSDVSVFRSGIGREILVVDLKDKKTVESVIGKYDLVFSIHSKQIFPEILVRSVKCINIHPGYNPVNRGWYPQVFAIIKDLPVGATIHEIDEQLDHGKIIDRELVEKCIDDTSESLYNKIVEKEMELLKRNLKKIVHNEYVSFEPENSGNLFLKSDFNELREIKLDEKLTALQFINKLRALTHGDFKNAFFIDPASGKRVYVRIKLEADHG